MEIKKKLTATEMNLLYYTMINTLYDEEDEYRYQFEEYLWRRAVIEAYTDIPIPEDIDEAYERCFDSALWSTVTTHIDIEQLNTIHNSISKYCENKEKRQIAGLQFHSLLEDMEYITKSIENFANLPEFLASLDNEENPSLGGD